MQSRDALLLKMQERPDIILLMEKLQAVLDQENKNRVAFRNKLNHYRLEVDRL